MGTVLFVLGTLVVLLGAAVLLTREGEVLRDAPRDRPDLGLPEQGLSAADLDGVRLTVAVRGYRMAEVDEVLERAATALAHRDAVIAALTGGAEPLPEVQVVPGAEPATPVPGEPVHVDRPTDVPPPAGDPDEQVAPDGDDRDRGDRDDGDRHGGDRHGGDPEDAVVRSGSARLPVDR